MKHTNKHAAVRQLKLWLEAGVLSKSEVEMVLQEVTGASSHTTTVGESAVPERVHTLSSFFTVKNLFYALGGLVLGLGILTFVWQVWDVIGSAGRILVTLGVGAGLVAAGVLYSQYGARALASAFFCIGAVLCGVGGLVVLSEINMLEQIPVTVWYAVMASLFAGLALTLRSVASAFFAVFYTVVTVYASMLVILSSLSLDWRQAESLFQWLTIGIGIGLLALAYTLQTTFASRLVGITGFFAINMILLPIAAKMFDNGVWQVVFFFANLGVIAIAVSLTRTWFLVIGMLYLFYFVTYITAEYFADSLGWPLSLILLGCVLMGLGYSSMNIHQRFIKGEK